MTTEQQIEDLVIQLRHLRSTSRDYALLVAEKEAELYDVMHKGTEVHGKWKLERSWPTNRRNWEHDQVAALVAVRALEARVPNEDGELPDRAGTVLAALLKAARPEWRVTVLREYHINPDLHCESEAGKKSVRITQVKPEGEADGSENTEA